MLFISSLESQFRDRFDGMKQSVCLIQKTCSKLIFKLWKDTRVAFSMVQGIHIFVVCFGNKFFVSFLLKCNRSNSQSLFTWREGAPDNRATRLEGLHNT